MEGSDILEKELKHISKFVRFMMENSDTKQKVAAECIGCSIGTFRNKLTQNRFSLKDLIILAELCGYHLALVPNYKENPTEILSVDDYIETEDRIAIKKYQEENIQKVLDDFGKLTESMTSEEKKKFWENLEKEYLENKNCIKK